jgi:hypothetical protein
MNTTTLNGEEALRMYAVAMVMTVTTTTVVVVNVGTNSTAVNGNLGPR